MRRDERKRESVCLCVCVCVCVWEFEKERDTHTEGEREREKVMPRVTELTVCQPNTGSTVQLPLLFIPRVDSTPQVVYTRANERHSATPPTYSTLQHLHLHHSCATPTQKSITLPPFSPSPDRVAALIFLSASGWNSQKYLYTLPRCGEGQCDLRTHSNTISDRYIIRWCRRSISPSVHGGSACARLKIKIKYERYCEKRSNVWGETRRYWGIFLR